MVFKLMFYVIDFFMYILGLVSLFNSISNLHGLSNAKVMMLFNS